jgi:hypothetical protein
MRLNKVTTYVCGAVCFVSMGLVTAYGLAQKTEKVEWLGWVMVAKPSTSLDPRIQMKKTYDALVREDIEIQYFGHFLSERGERMRPQTG